ncbi:peptide ABC transporter substrate-binding protein, partial [Rhizobium leguminosarum]
IGRAADSSSASCSAFLKIAARLVRSVSALPIYYYVSKNVVSPKIEGFVDNIQDIHRNRWLSMKE